MAGKTISARSSCTCRPSGPRVALIPGFRWWRVRRIRRYPGTRSADADPMGERSVRGQTRTYSALALPGSLNGPATRCTCPSVPVRSPVALSQNAHAHAHALMRIEPGRLPYGGASGGFCGVWVRGYCKKSLSSNNLQSAGGRHDCLVVYWLSLIARRL